MRLMFVCKLNPFPDFFSMQLRFCSRASVLQIVIDWTVSESCSTCFIKVLQFMRPKIKLGVLGSSNLD